MTRNVPEQIINIESHTQKKDTEISSIIIFSHGNHTQAFDDKKSIYLRR